MVSYSTTVEKHADFWNQSPDESCDSVYVGANSFLRENLIKKAPIQTGLLSFFLRKDTVFSIVQVAEQ